MSTFTKRFSMIFVLALIVNLLAPLTNAFAATPDTDLTIHKITGDKEIETTPGMITGEETPEGNPVPNISFTYWKVTAAQLATMKADSANYKTEAQVAALVGTKTATTAKTDVNGEVTIEKLAAGSYWFIEDPSTAVKDAKAVPFGLELPITNQDGSGYITNLHVYPKNTLQDTPTIDKDVKTEGNKSSSFAVGEEFNWLIQPTVVTGINEYKTFKVTDTIDSKLTFQGVDKVTATLNGAELVKNTDYTVSYTAPTVTVEFTQAGLDKLGAAVGGKLNIMIPTVINNTAVMGQPILNDATLIFDNNHGVTGEPNVSDNNDLPKVYTGGKNFVKTDGASTNLAGAQFVIKNAAGDFLQQDDKLNVTWVDTQAAATIFESDADGKFEVKGLPYGEDKSNNEGSTDYTLVEIKAPKDYTLPTDPETKFTVNATSYYAEPMEVKSAADAATATPQTIVNQKTTLPMTGGMGTVLFTVVGLGLMALALVFFRRKQQA